MAGSDEKKTAQFNALEIIGIAPKDFAKITAPYLDQLFMNANTSMATNINAEQILTKAEIEAYLNKTKKSGDVPDKADRYGAMSESEDSAAKVANKYLQEALSAHPDGLTRKDLDAVATKFAQDAEAKGDKNGVLSLREVMNGANFNSAVVNTLMTDGSVRAGLAEVIAQGASHHSDGEAIPSQYVPATSEAVKATGTGRK